MNRFSTLPRALILAVAISSLFARSIFAADDNAGPWPAPVAGFKSPAAGEHPRLFFRQADLPELRRRAETPAGKAMVTRLKHLLGGGESMPKHFNDNPSVGQNAQGPKELPEGAYTHSHVAGFGMLYQLTGDKKYADLGRQCMEKAFEGVLDRDERYGWEKPGGALRAGPSLGWYAVGYDLCYDGWLDDFRRKVALEIQNYNKGQFMSLEELAQGKRHHPGSNHWGPQVGGGALALLAIAGDPGVDNGKIAKLLAANEKNMVRHMTEGFGDHGFFPEGDGPGAIASDTAFVPALQAWKIAGGKDFISPRPNGQWLTLKWLMGTIDGGDGPEYPKRGGYPHNVWARNGMSGTGAFCQGFGAIDEQYKPALLWMYNHVFKEADEKAGTPYDTCGPYPGRCVLALINWPIDLTEKNPGDVMPHAVADAKWSYYTFRNRWQNEDDIVVTWLANNTKGYGTTPGGDIMIWGLGEKLTFPVKVSGKVTSFAAGPSGGVASTSAGSLGVDFSKASGAEALVILSGPIRGNIKSGESAGGKVRTQSIAAGDNHFIVLSLAAAGKHPELKADGNKLIAGGQIVSVDGGKLVFASTAGK